MYQHLHYGGTKKRRDSKELKKYEEMMMENFPNLVKEIDIQVQEVQRGVNKMNSKRSISRQIIIKMPKN